MIKSLKMGDSIDALMKEFVDYDDELLPHLAEEEEIGLPLMMAFFKPEDLKPAIEQIIKRSPKLEMGSVVQGNGIETFRNVLMANEGIPSFVWYIDFYWKYRAFLKAFTYNVQALVDGEERKKRFMLF